MNKNEKYVITLNRELGSGGHTVGKILSDKLGVPYYDNALIIALSEKFKLNTDEIEQLKGQDHSWWGELKRKLLPDVASRVHYYKIEEGKEPYPLTTGALYKVEKELLQNMAEGGSCIIAGRMGFHVLRNHPNHLRILIQASMEHRIARVAKKKQISEEEAKKIIKHVDEQRENCVKKFAETSRYDCRNYDIVINMDDKTEEEAANIILKYIG